MKSTSVRKRALGGKDAHAPKSRVTGVLVLAMKKPLKLYLGDWIEMKKPHPCGGKEWEIMRVGMDFRLKCLTCGRIILIPDKTGEGF